MKTKNCLILTTVFFFAFGAAACGSKTADKNNSAVQNINKTAVVADRSDVKTTNDNQLETVKTANDENSAADTPDTPTAAYKTAFSAREKKDVSGLKKVLSKKMLAFFTEMGKSENKTLDDELKELTDQPQSATAEVRSEKITGETAALEYLDERGKWKPMDFVKEDGEWKLTMPAAPPIIENTVPKSR